MNNGSDFSFFRQSFIFALLVESQLSAYLPHDVLVYRVRNVYDTNALDLSKKLIVIP